MNDKQAQWIAQNNLCYKYWDPHKEFERDKVYYYLGVVPVLLGLIPEEPWRCYISCVNEIGSPVFSEALYRHITETKYEDAS